MLIILLDARIEAIYCKRQTRNHAADIFSDLTGNITNIVDATLVPAIPRIECSTLKIESFLFCCSY